jgi:hypothetical protein
VRVASFISSDPFQLYDNNIAVLPPAIGDMLALEQMNVRSARAAL